MASTVFPSMYMPFVRWLCYSPPLRSHSAPWLWTGLVTSLTNRICWKWYYMNSSSEASRDLASLKLWGEDAQTSWGWGTTWREKPSQQPAPVASHVSEAILDHPAPVRPPGLQSQEGPQLGKREELPNWSSPNCWPPESRANNMFV